jgi:hypothetical protein
VSRSPSGFETAVDDLDPEERASFVTAVYDARGWEAERVGTVVSVRPPIGGADSRRVAPPGVTATDGVVALSSADLLEMMRYAVASDDRGRLCRRFFDRSAEAVGVTDAHTGTPAEGLRTADEQEARRAPVASPDGTSERGDPDDAPGRPTDGASDDDRGGDRRTLATPSARSAVAVALGLVCAVVVVAALATWAGVPADDSPGSAPVGEAPGVGNASTAAEPSETPTDGRSSDGGDDPIEDSASGRQIVLETSYPPGVGVDGVENASVLAAAHRSALSGRSYRLSITSREAVDGLRTAVAWEWTVVETASRYRSTVRVAGTFRRSPPGVANASTYANGTARIARVGPNTDADGTVRFESPPADNRSPSDPGHRVVGPAPDADPFAGRTASILRRALSGTGTAVTGTVERDGTTYFRIEIRNASPAFGADGGALIVDERGLVHEIRYARTVVSLDSVPVKWTITVRITPSNATLVSPPWYRPAARAPVGGGHTDSRRPARPDDDQ